MTTFASQVKAVARLELRRTLSWRTLWLPLMAGMPLVVLDHHDLDRLLRRTAVHALLLLPGVHRRGSVTVNVLPWPSVELSPIVPLSRRTNALT